MKRCIQCDFIYEDDQSRCDMDGRELVPAPLPVAPGKPETQSVRAAKPRSRRVLLPAIAGVLVGILLLLGYYGFALQRPPPRVTRHSSAEVTSAPPAVPETIAHPSPQPTSQVQPAPGIVPVLPRNTTIPSSGQPLKSSSANPRAIQTVSPIAKPEPKKANHKKDSKIGSFFKKTARALKKPFKM